MKAANVIILFLAVNLVMISQVRAADPVIDRKGQHALVDSGVSHLAIPASSGDSTIFPLRSVTTPITRGFQG